MKKSAAVFELEHAASAFHRAAYITERAAAAYPYRNRSEGTVGNGSTIADLEEQIILVRRALQTLERRVKDFPYP